MPLPKNSTYIIVLWLTFIASMPKLRITIMSSQNQVALITYDVHFAIRALATSKAHNVTNLQRQYFPRLHAKTIWQQLVTCGLKAYVCRKRPFLLKKHKARHLKWAKAYQHWTTNDWKAVVFSNKFKFNLFGSNGHCWCWRKPDE